MSTLSASGGFGIPEEVLQFLEENPTSVEFIDFNEEGHILLPAKVRIDLGNGHDYGRCLLSRNPKVSYDESVEVRDEAGNLVQVGEFTFEVQVMSANQRKIDTGETRVQIDRATMTRVETPVIKNESRVMVVANQVTPIAGSPMLPFPIEEIDREVKLRRSSDRRTGKMKPEAKGKTVRAGKDDIVSDAFFASADTGEIFRWGNPEPEIVVPESPQRASIMAAYCEEYADSPPSKEEVSEFLASVG